MPAGSVALAGEFSGVYPRESPGGWQLIGRTELAVFDLDRDPPALLAPRTGCASSRRTCERAGRPRGGESGARGEDAVEQRASRGRSRVVVVESSGPLTTLQDEGRSGRAAIGVGRSGACDRASYRLANRLVGNHPGRSRWR